MRRFVAYSTLEGQPRRVFLYATFDSGNVSVTYAHESLAKFVDRFLLRDFEGTEGFPGVPVVYPVGSEHALMAVADYLSRTSRLTVVVETVTLTTAVAKASVVSSGDAVRFAEAYSQLGGPVSVFATRALAVWAQMVAAERTAAALYGCHAAYRLRSARQALAERPVASRALLGEPSSGVTMLGLRRKTGFALVGSTAADEKPSGSSDRSLNDLIRAAQHAAQMQVSAMGNEFRV